VQQRSLTLYRLNPQVSVERCPTARPTEPLYSHRVAKIRIGISGWQYPPWRGTFYPKTLTQKNELQFAAGKVPVIEINGSFYALQRPESYEKWYEETPKDFVFTVKGPRYITHIRRLKEVEKPLANFFASGVLNLKEKLGPILWQFAPNFPFDPEQETDRMQRFLEMLPHDFAAAAKLARKRDSFMKGRTSVRVDKNRRLRHAIEIRNESFDNPDFVALLRKFGVALVIAETARKWPMLNDVTADFMYLRLHGDKELYKGGYSDKSLDGWAKRIAAWHRGGEPSGLRKVTTKSTKSARSRDVFCFFDNTDVKLRAPFDAQSLAKKLKLKR
jgi:uncharacterized protein YecE (DUF72 family)